MRTKYGARMFVARLLTALKTPATHLGGLDDTLVLDVDLYRGALLHLVQKLSDEGAIDDPTAAWTLACIADGWIDEHLGNVRDGLLELGAVRDQAHLHRLLLAATQHILGCGPGAPAHGLVAAAPEVGAEPPLTAADLLLLQAVTQALQEADGDHEPLGLRLLVRRYALELGLLSRDGAAQDVIRRTPIGDALLALPTSHRLAFLLALEMLQAQGPADRWRTPRSALSQMQAQPQFLVATTATARRAVDPVGLFPWRRIRRLRLLGVCEPVRLADAQSQAAGEDPGRDAYPYRLSPLGAAAIAWVLAEPRTELVELAELLLSARAQVAVEPLRRHLPGMAPALQPERQSLLALPLRLLSPGSDAVLAAEPLGASTIWSSDPAAAYPLALSAAAPAPGPAAPASGGEVAWQVAGPLATLPATAAALTGALLSDALLASMGELSAVPGKPPGSGPCPDGGSRQELDIGGLIQRAWAELHVAGVHFTLLGPTVSAIGERRALLQAWRELLRSAADAAVQGTHSPPLVTVELNPEPDAVQILVHDSGPPLTAEDAATLAHVELAPLSREPGPLLGFADLADSGTRLALDGMRRGLWLAQRTLTEQGAQLALSTPQLGGTTVRITLPRSPRPLRSAA